MLCWAETRVCGRGLVPVEHTGSGGGGGFIHRHTRIAYMQRKTRNLFASQPVSVKSQIECRCV